MRVAQEQELLTVENAQRVQYQEFSSAWDKYMQEYEQAAFQSLENLKVTYSSSELNLLGKTYIRDN